jgi:hypothetical protein
VTLRSTRAEMAIHRHGGKKPGAAGAMTGVKAIGAQTPAVFQATGRR